MPGTVQTELVVGEQTEEHVAAMQDWTAPVGIVPVHAMPHLPQLETLVWRSTQLVGAAVGHAVSVPALATQVPVAQVMHPAAASGHELEQQIPPTHVPLAQSLVRVHCPPMSRLARQDVPEQKNPGAHGRLLLQVVAHAVDEAQPKPLQVVAVPAVHVRDVEQPAAGTKVTALVVAVQAAGAHLFVQLPHVAGRVMLVSQPTADVQSARPSLHT